MVWAVIEARMAVWRDHIPFGKRIQIYRWSVPNGMLSHQMVTMALRAWATCPLWCVPYRG